MPKARANPKSAILRSSLKPSRIFYGLRSLCMILREWHAATPLSNWCMYHLTAWLLKHCPEMRVSIFFLRSRSKYSNTRYILVGHMITSLSCTTFLWSISLSTEISLMVVLGTPSDCVSSLIFLSAMISLVLVLIPLCTTPYAPSPSCSIFWMCSICPNPKPYLK